MRVLVQGGAGFLGSWVVDELVARGHDVVVYDNLSSCWLDEEADPAEAKPKFANAKATYSKSLTCYDDGVYDALVVLSSIFPVERDRDVVWTNAKSFVDLTTFGISRLSLRRNFRRVVVGSSASVRSKRSDRIPFACQALALRQLLVYWHRPPRMAIEFLQLPDLYGPRQLPELSPIVRVLSGQNVSTWDNPFGYAAPVEVAAAEIADRVEVTRLNADIDRRYAAPVVAPHTFARFSLEAVGLKPVDPHRLQESFNDWAKGIEVDDVTDHLLGDLNLDMAKEVRRCVDFYRELGIVNG